VGDVVLVDFVFQRIVCGVVSAFTILNDLVENIRDTPFCPRHTFRVALLAQGAPTILHSVRVICAGRARNG
jgi:hypothetical protein